MCHYPPFLSVRKCKIDNCFIVSGYLYWKSKKRYKMFVHLSYSKHKGVVFILSILTGWLTDWLWYWLANWAADLSLDTVIRSVSDQPTSWPSFGYSGQVGGWYWLTNWPADLPLGTAVSKWYWLRNWLAIDWSTFGCGDQVGGRYWLTDWPADLPLGTIARLVRGVTR